MSLSLSTVTNSIAGIDVSGLIIKDKDEIPAAGDVRKSILIPQPNFVTNFSMVRDSFGGGSVAKMTIEYDLNYRLLYAPLGDGRSKSLNTFSAMVDMVSLIWDAVLAIDTLTGIVDITPNGINNMGQVNDPSEQPFWGCDLSFHVEQFVN